MYLDARTHRARNKTTPISQAITIHGRAASNRLGPGRADWGNPDENDEMSAGADHIIEPMKPSCADARNEVPGERLINVITGPSIARNRATHAPI
jgi:hypothetical protein